MLKLTTVAILVGFLTIACGVSYAIANFEDCAGEFASCVSDCGSIVEDCVAQCNDTDGDSDSDSDNNQVVEPETCLCALECGEFVARDCDVGCENRLNVCNLATCFP